MIRQTISSRRFRTVAASALVAGLAFTAGTAFGAAASDPLLEDAKMLLSAARVDLEIASPAALGAKAQRAYDRHINKAIRAIDNALASIEDAEASVGLP